MKLHFLFPFLFLIGLLSGQNSTKLDSLLKVLPALNDDSLKVKTLNLIADNYNNTIPKKAIEFANKALDISEKLEWKKGIANSYFTIGYSNYAMGNYPISIENYIKSLELRTELKNKKDIANVLANIGSSYHVLGNNLKALEYYMKSLKIREEIGSKKGIAKSLCNIGMIYKNQKDYDKALNYFSRALQQSIELKDLENQAIYLGNIGGLYWNKGDFKRALENYFKALSIDEKLNNKRNVSAWLANIAGVYSTEGDSAKEKGNNKLFDENYSKTLEFSLRGLKIADELGDEGITTRILGNIGALYLTIGKYNKSEEYLQKSLEIGMRLNFTDAILEDYLKFYELYREMHDYPKALEYYEKYTNLKDSVFSQEAKKNISELQIKYEAEKKETENNALTQQNKILELSATNNKYIMFGLLTVLIFVLSFGILIIRQNKLKSRQENVRLEQKLLRTQMNPHFIFNSLSSIESFIYEHQPKEAGDYLARFARLMRLILENSSLEYITLEKELEALNYYLSLQKLRLYDNLEYSIDIDTQIDPERIFIPPMLTQPFIENAIEHGFRGITKCGVLKISFKLKENYLEVKIIDNGIGIVEAQQQKDLYNSHKSMAMEITHERLNLLNKSKKQKLIFDIKELIEEGQKKGTEVLFSIPV